MFYRLGRLAPIALLFSTRALPAQADSAHTPGVPLSVESVVTGGSWKADGASGRYRVVGVTSGWEEVRHRVRLEWIQEPDTMALDRIRATVDLNDAAGIYGLAGPRLVRRGKVWLVIAQGASRPLTEYQETITFALGPPGQVRRVRHP